LHGVKFVGGAGDAAGTCDRRKSHEVYQLHRAVPFRFRDG
jgi:hypothetical protein